MEWFQYLSFGSHGWGDELLAGLGISLSLALVTLPLGLLLGFIVAAASLSRKPVANNAAKVYTTTVRGIPELLTLFIIYHGVGLLLNHVSVWLGLTERALVLSPFCAGVVALGLVFGAYSSEVIRGAWQALDRGQREAAQAIGMPRFQIFHLIELPPLLRLALPGLGNLWVNLLKDTALVSVIALNDLMRMTNVAVGFTKKPFLFYLSACLMYWIVCMLFEWCIALMERRVSRGIRVA